MAMRYIIRRTKAEDLTEIRRDVSDLDSQIGKAGENYRRAVEVSYTPSRSAVFQFSTRKEGTNWIWVCPSVELVAEDEAGLFTLTEKFKVPKPSHLIIT